MSVLARRIVAACDAAGISVSAFGRYVGKDPRLVPEIKKGRQPQGELRSRIERAIAMDAGALNAAVRKCDAKAMQAGSLGRIVRMLETGQKNGTIGAETPELPSNPAVPFLGGAFLCAEGMVMIEAHGGRVLMPPDDAEQLGQRLLALAGQAKARAAA